MTVRKPRASKPVPEKPKADPFSLFIERGLHEMYDAVMNEPIPEELLKLIEDGRPK